MAEPDLADARRICVIGNAASGKSYLAQELARRLRLRYIDFDGAVVKPNWERVPRADRVLLFDRLTSGDGWTIDGHLRSDRAYEQLILSRADTVIWLDFPRWRVMASVIRRTLWNTVTRKRVWGGNVEGWSTLLSPDHAIRWAWASHDRLKRDYERLFADPAQSQRTLIRFRSRGEVNRWLASGGAGPKSRVTRG